MANRSYLYATDLRPGEFADGAQARIAGLSEAAYHIPLSYRLLLSSAPRVGPSLIWDDEPSAIVGDSDGGLARLSAFLDRLADTAPPLRPACDEATAFLSLPANRRAHFVLEAGEMFDMTDTPLGQQAEALLEDIRAIDADADTFIDAVARRSTYEGDPVDVGTADGEANALRWAGIGYWSNVLYFDLSPDEPQTVDAFAKLATPPVMPPRPPIPFWTPILGTAVLVLSVVLTGNATWVSSEVTFGIVFLSTYAAATVLCTAALWGAWWMRHRRRG